MENWSFLLCRKKNPTFSLHVRVNILKKLYYGYLHTSDHIKLMSVLIVICIYRTIYYSSISAGKCNIILSPCTSYRDLKQGCTHSTICDAVRVFNAFLNDKFEHFENIAGKGENAGYQHFLLFLQCFLYFPNVTQNLIFFPDCRNIVGK